MKNYRVHPTHWLISTKVARKHKEEQKLAEWRENARIDREAREAQDETERRRAMVKAQRDARIAR